MTFEATTPDKGTQQSAADQSATGTTDNQGAAEGSFNQQSNTGQQVFLVAGDRAFRDADAAVKHITHAAGHIATLESERKADRELLAALEAENARLKQIAEAHEQAAQKGSTNSNNSGNAATTQQLSKEEVAATVISQLNENNRAEQEKANMTAALQAAKEAYGNEYIDKVNAIGAEHGMDYKAIDQMAKQQPKVFATLFLPKANKDGTPFSPTHSSVNTGSFTSQNSNEGERKRFNAVKAKPRELAAEVSRRLAEFKD